MSFNAFWPGKGMVNPQRCATAVFKRRARNGGLRASGLNAASECETA
jgi:hypothetical protein